MNTLEIVIDGEWRRVPVIKIEQFGVGQYQLGILEDDIRVMSFIGRKQGELLHVRLNGVEQFPAHLSMERTPTLEAGAIMHHKALLSRAWLS